MNNFCVLDVETTGTDKENDRIVSICILKEAPFEPFIYNRLINPGIPIPQGATDVHGITDEMVHDLPNFKAVAKEILEFIQGCDIGGFNSNSFDLPLFYNELLRAGITWDYSKVNFIDMRNIYTIREPRTLEAAYKFYTGKPLENAHDAKADVLATYEVWKKQQEFYTDLPTDPKELALYCNYGKCLLDISGKFTYNDAGEIVFNFGKHKPLGSRAADERGYLDWMLKGNFAPDTKAIALKIWKGEMK